MRPQIQVVAVALLASACNVATPAQPTFVPAAVAPAVPTSQPDRWDTRDELAAWVTNSYSSGSASVVGEGTDAVIRIDLPADVDINLHSPEFTPPHDNLRTFRLRFRWLADPPYVTSHFPWIFLLLQPPTLDRDPHSSPIWLGNGVYQTDGTWIETELIGSASTQPPFSADGAVLNIDRTEHGRVEIDWIALVRQ
jgi:hypothetical protein